MNLGQNAARAAAAIFPAAPRLVEAAPPRSAYRVGAAYDWFFFILSPLWALALGLFLGPTRLGRPQWIVDGQSESALSLFSGVFTMAHLSLVFFRTHANRDVFRAHRARFVLAPLALFGFLMLHSWTLVFGFVAAVWWDVYHSSLQTFGFGRFYDARRNADRDAGRSLDRSLSFILYAGPIFAGASLAEHAVHFKKFDEVGVPGLGGLYGVLMANRPALSAALAAVVLPYVAWYLWSYWKLSRAGYAVSREKIVLYASTALCSVWAWGFNPYDQAFFIMNFFHSLQYFALVAHAERGSVAERAGLGRTERGKAFAAAGMVAAAFAYGVWAQFFGETSHFALSVVITVSLLHFWYDSFIWSVRRSQL